MPLCCAGELVTRANGDIRGSTGRTADCGQLGLIDTDCRAIGLHLYDGLLKVTRANPLASACLAVSMFCRERGEAMHLVL
jgi:hypothetical protein